jgi:hypothetical protein
VRTLPKKRYDGPEFVRWIVEESDALSSAVKQIATTIDKKLGEALGEPGVSGDAIKILDTMNSLFAHCRCFLTFEMEVSAAEVPYAYSRLKGAFSGLTLGLIRMLEDLSVQWTRNVEALRNGSHTFALKVHLDSLPQLGTALEELEKIKTNPELFQGS